MPWQVGGRGQLQLGRGCASWSGVGRLAGWEVDVLLSPCLACSRAVHLLAPTLQLPCACPCIQRLPCLPRVRPVHLSIPTSLPQLPHGHPVLSTHTASLTLYVLQYLPPPSLAPQPPCASFKHYRLSQLPLARAGLVETSNNVASLQPSASSPDDTMVIVTSTRSSLGHALEAVRDTIEATARAFGASAVVRNEAYPGWAPNPQSEVLQVRV